MIDVPQLMISHMRSSQMKPQKKSLYDDHPFLFSLWHENENDSQQKKSNTKQKNEPLKTQNKKQKWIQKQTYDQRKGVHILNLPFCFAINIIEILIMTSSIKNQKYST